MLKYTLLSDGKFITFTGIVGTDKEGIRISHQKSLIKELVNDSPKSALVFVDIDDYTDEYKYTEVVNPVTGDAFISLASFRSYVMIALNSESIQSNLFIDNWDAIANSPVLADGGLYDSTGDLTPDATAPNSKYFIVINADATTPSNNTTLNGENAWTVGDLVRSTGTKWVREPRVEQVAAINTSYVNTVGISDPSWNNIEEAQAAIDELYSRVENFSGTLVSLLDTDLTTTAPITSDILTYNGSKWVPQKPSRRDLVEVVSRVDGTGAAPTIDGNYILTVGISAGWLPGSSAVGDILKRSSGVWTVYFDMSTKAAGSTEIVYTASPNEGANYVWDGNGWEEIDAYEPNATLDAITVSNTSLGDISTPPYGAPAFTGSSIRGRSISKILDDILFQTVPHTYISPTISYASSGTVPGNLERGTLLTGALSGTYTKNDGGDLDNTDPSQGSLDELKIELTVGGTNTKLSNSHASGNRSLEFDMDTEISVAIPGSASTSTVGYFKVTANTADGTPIADNKGGDTPQDSGYGGNTLAQTLATQVNYYSRYPIWYGPVSERFTIASTISESTDISIDPNSGTNLGGTLLNDSWLKTSATGLKRLFTTNLVNTNSISPSNGNAHVLIACPPGITVLSIQESVAGQWVSLTNNTHYKTFSLTGITDAEGANPVTYNCCYIRDLSNITFPNRTFRFTTTGIITS